MSDALKPTEKDERVAFMVRLGKMARLGFSARDVIILYWIMTNPGYCAHDIARGIGVPNVSSILLCFRRLKRAGFIVDRRVEKRMRIPCNYHVLPAGEAWWADLMGISRAA